MAGPAGQVRAGNPEGAVTVHPELARLLESGEFDWDDLRQREAYLRAWLGGAFRQQGDPGGRQD